MMKMTWKHILPLLVLLLTACGRERQPVVPVPSKEPIVFSPRTSEETKGKHPLVSLDLLADQRFSVSAWYTPENETFGSSSVLYFGNHQFGTLDKVNFSSWQGTFGTGNEEVADPLYYPLDGTLSYFCYAPYREDVSSSSSDIQVLYNPGNEITDLLPDNYLSGSPIIRFRPFTAVTSLIDFLAAKPVLDANRNGGPVALDFTEHLTTFIEFYIKYTGNVDPSEGITVSSITLRNVIGDEFMYFTDTDGTLGHAWCSDVSPVDNTSTMPRASYTLSNSDLKGDYLDPVTPLYINETLNGRLYLLPQVLPTDSWLDIVYNVKSRGNGWVLDENIVSIPLNGTTPWPQGKIIRYTITITIADRSEVAITNIQIIDWVDALNDHTAEEITY